MINYYAVSKARFFVDKCGTKEVLIDNELFANKCNDVEIFKIIPSLTALIHEVNFPKQENLAYYICLAWAIVEKSIVDENLEKIQNDFWSLIPIYKDSAFSRIELFYNNVNERKYDDILKDEDRKIILENSITFFEEKFSSLRESRQYKKYQKELELQEKKEKKRKDNTAGQRSFDSIVEELKNNKKDRGESIVDWITYNSIITGLRENIQSPNETITQTILDSLKKMKMNFYIEYEPGFKIYPLLVDMLNDLFLIEYFFHHQKSQTRPLTSAKVWPEVIEEYEEDVKSYKYLFFAKLVRVEEIGSRNIRPYFLAEYARTLNVDIKELRTLMQNIFFPIPENHSSSFGLKFDKISNIEPAPFLLENTKMVIGGI